ncbi:MAG: ABC transporter ATP-binding protein [Alphaproteobacteria bacterium]|nr:ABC transporter ATP-binding protein [Alphaproteobacteria bacterium]
MAEGEVRLKVQGLARRYGALAAVQGVDLAVAGGEILGLLGPNGAGKTTTLECILGLRRPDAGTIAVCGIDALADPRGARARIGAVLQQTGLQDRITPREALAQFIRLCSAPDGVGHDPATLLARFGLTDKADAFYESLSGGLKQRLALALAFAGDPALLLLDEPAAGLDVGMRRALHDDMRAMRTEGRALLLTTHDMDEAAQLCDRVAVMAKGRIVAEGSPASLIGGHASLEEAILALTGGPS